jgi:putative transposase
MCSSPENINAHFDNSMNDAEPELTGPKPAPGNPEPQLGRTGTEAELGLGGSGGNELAGWRGWHSRGYLPHFDSPDVLQSVTFRLADSLPHTALRQLKAQRKHIPPHHKDLEWRRRIEDWSDSGMGCCALGHPQVAAVMQETLALFDWDRYRLVAWCIMPNHVHVLIKPYVSLSKIVQSWKSYTGRWALQRNAELGLGVPGAAFWMRDYWDRYIRSERHFHLVVAYIHNNPVKAGLCSAPREWLWSSARRYEE